MILGGGGSKEGEGESGGGEGAVEERVSVERVNLIGSVIHTWFVSFPYSNVCRRFYTSNIVIDCSDEISVLVCDMNAPANAITAQP